MDYYKNKLMKKFFNEYYETFSCTLDTADYVPEKYNDKIYKIIFVSMKKQFRELEKEVKVHNKQIKLKLKLKSREEKAVKEKPKSKLALLFSKLFARIKRRKIVKEKADYCCETTIDECDSTSALDNSTSEYTRTQQTPNTVPGDGCPTASDT